jgi:hypothetical protein
MIFIAFKRDQDFFIHMSIMIIVQFIYTKTIRHEKNLENIKICINKSLKLLV